MCVEQTLETCTIRYSFCTHLERNFQTSRHKRKHILSVNKPQHPPPPQKNKPTKKEVCTHIGILRSSIFNSEDE